MEAEQHLERLRADALEHMVLTATRDFKAISTMVIVPVDAGSVHAMKAQQPKEEDWVWAAKQLALDEAQVSGGRWGTGMLT